MTRSHRVTAALDPTDPYLARIAARLEAKGDRVELKPIPQTAAKRRDGKQLVALYRVRGGTGD